MKECIYNYFERLKNNEIKLNIFLLFFIDKGIRQGDGSIVLLRF